MFRRSSVSFPALCFQNQNSFYSLNGSRISITKVFHKNKQACDDNCLVQATHHSGVSCGFNAERVPSNRERQPIRSSIPTRPLPLIILIIMKRNFINNQSATSASRNDTIIANHMKANRICLALQTTCRELKSGENGVAFSEWENRIH